MAKMLPICPVVVLWLLLFLYGCRTPTGRMSAGEITYRGKCASCHNLIAPAEFTPDEWRTYVERYGKKLRHEEKQLILDYLTRDLSDEASRENIGCSQN